MSGPSPADHFHSKEARTPREPGSPQAELQRLTHSHSPVEGTKTMDEGFEKHAEVAGPST